jgi:hypothetical protein
MITSHAEVGGFKKGKILSPKDIKSLFKSREIYDWPSLVICKEFQY